MRFYQLTGMIINNIWETEKSESGIKNVRIRRRNGAPRFFRVKSEQFYERVGNKGYFFVSKADEEDATIEVGIIDAGLADMEKSLDKYLKLIGVEVEDRVLEEVTFKTLRNLLGVADRNDFISEDEEILERFELMGLLLRFRGRPAFGENILQDIDKKLALKLAEEYLLEKTAGPELERIFSVQNTLKKTGHPVHYLLMTDDKDVRREGAQLLLKSLYSTGRIKNRRYCFTDIDADDELYKGPLETLFKSNIGGAFIIRFVKGDSSENEFASMMVQNAEMVGEMVMKYRNRVLTVLCLPRECTGLKKLLFENLGHISLVEIEETLASGTRAVNYLKRLAKENSIRPDKSLFGKLEEGKGYLAPDLNDLFEEWYDRKLKTSVYPQYKEVQAVKHEVAKEKPKGTAYDELMGLIGLTEAKKVINQALDFYKAQKVFADMGMKTENASMHMVFTGNPGSAKTTVARLFSTIMRDNRLLSKGHLVEVGRGDLVGKYVGWTAKIVQEKFKEAEGGVLFIDEAYSLVDDRDGMYGDEAINTIVQEMENRRDRVVVIFAGYPDKMEGFLQKNPGLRSRIAFHVAFADYNADELVSIAELMCGQKGLVLEEDAKKKMRGILETVSSEKDFGNGRYVRNMLEKARMAQASRLLAMDLDFVTKDDIVTIKADDIEVPETVKPVKKPIGFIAA